MKTFREYLAEAKVEKEVVNEGKDNQLEKYIKISKNDIQNIKKILNNIVKRIEDVELDDNNMKLYRKNYIKFSNDDIDRIEKIGNEIVSRLEDFRHDGA